MVRQITKVLIDVNQRFQILIYYLIHLVQINQLVLGADDGELQDTYQWDFHNPVLIFHYQAN